MKKTSRCFLAMLVLLCMLFNSTAIAAASGITPPSSVHTIESEAFYNNDSIESVTVPASVTEIGSLAYAGCDALKDVYFEGNSVSIATDAFKESPLVHFHVNTGSEAESFAVANNIPYTIISETNAMFYSDLARLVSAQDLTSSILQSNEFGTMRLLVKTNGSALPDLSEYDLLQCIQGPDGVYVLQFATVESTTQCFTMLEDWEGKVFVEPDSCVSTGIGNASAASLGSSWSDSDPMNFNDYADYLAENGSGSVTVAVIDSGVGMHSAINSRVRNDGANLVDGNGARHDGANHGTSVAGIIVDSTPGLNVNILPVRAVNDQGLGTPSSIGNGIGYAINAGADIINLSLSIPKSAYVEMMINKAISSGISVVVAAGNSGINCADTFPANMASCVTVSAIGPSKTKTGESNYGSTIDFCAPGDGVTGYLPGGGSTTRHGTSFAAPHISAALAMTHLDPIRRDLADCCEDLGDAGKDSVYGHGLPDLSIFAKRQVTSINLLTSISKMVTNASLYLQYTVKPDNASDKTISVVSDNPDVVKVSSVSDGFVLIETQNEGTATLTFTANDGFGATTSHTIQVVRKVSSVDITGASSLLYAGRTMQLGATITPENATNPGITWTSSNDSIAAVDQNGLVTGVSDGNVTITATAQDGYGAKDSIELEVKTVPNAQSVVITPANTTVKLGDSIQLSAQVLPEGAIQNVSWSIGSGADLASIDQNGLLTTGGVLGASGTGTVVVFATSENNVNGVAIVNVVQPPESIAITGPQTVREDKTIQLTAEVLPVNANDRTVSWHSSNTAVATVDAEGVVTGVSAGDATIFATANGNTDLVQGYAVTVTPKEFTITFNANGGSCSTASMTAVCEEAVGTLPTPTRDYYTFDGWFTATSGGTKITSSYAFETDTPVTLYAQWTLNPESDWVLQSAVPSGAQITATSYSYRQTTESYSSSLSGWNRVGTAEGSGWYWKAMRTGNSEYATIPSGFDPNNYYYYAFRSSAYTSSTTDTTKRVASSSHAGYIYWHWMYNVAYADSMIRTISSKSGTWDQYGNNSGDHSYQYFYAFASSADYPDAGTNYCCSRGERSYNCREYILANTTAAERSNPTSGIGTNRFFRFPYESTSYTDYDKYYYYYRDLQYQATDPGNGSNITNKQVYVKYRAK